MLHITGKLINALLYTSIAAHDLLFKSAKLCFCGRMYGIEYAVKLHKKKVASIMLGKSSIKTMRRDIMEKTMDKIIALAKAKRICLPGF